MRHGTVQDKISRGYGSAARAIGDWCDVYRPQDTMSPLDGRHHILRLRAAFLPADGRVRAPVGFGHVAWQGVFDAGYTQPGDFIVRRSSDSDGSGAATYFVASQQPLLPTLCIRTSARIEVVRLATSTTLGAAAYGGIGALSTVTILSDWPVSIINSSGAGLNPLDLPATVAPGSWEVLLPTVSGMVLRTNDRVTDDLGRAAIITSVELSDLGWRVIAKEIAS